MPPKNLAGILNNESNLRILEKLKERPYYPRELAGAMGISEAFVVRRLKAMEEYDIVEGRWETEGGRKVKRYYIRDINMQLGRDGLKVTSVEARPGGEIDLKKEAAKLLIVIPIVLFVFYVINSRNAALMAATCLYWVWQILINVALYRHYPYKSIATVNIVYVVGIVFVSTILGILLLQNDLTANSAVLIQLFFIALGLVLLVGAFYYIRFSIAEARNIAVDIKNLITSLNSASLPVKLFYLPIVFRWKVGEYFNYH